MKYTRSDTSTRKAWGDRLKAVDPKRVKVSSRGLVNTSFLDNSSALPLVIEPNFPSVELHVWAKDNLDFIDQKLMEYGGVLFRGFALERQEGFERFLSSLGIELMRYIESATPRKELGAKIYTSTEFPQDQVIALHNELTYVATWPMKILFFCRRPADSQGETPIADVRRVYARIDREIIEEFAEKGWQLVRNYGNGFGPTWQDAFHMTDRSTLEVYCRDNRIDYEWKDNVRFKTRQVRPAISVHPKTGEAVWFNHVAFWHVSSLDPKLRELFLTEFGEDELPYNTYYGDGSSIKESVVEKIREAYSQETVMFQWKQCDLLLLDNMLVAHGRNSFKGSREIIVAMGEPYRPGSN